MFLQKLTPDQLHPAYNILFHVFYPWDDVVTPPFGMAWGVIEPDGQTLQHNHHEAETFIITGGEGRLTVAGRTEQVEQGDVIFFPPFTPHLLENTSQEKPLEFMTIWWEDMGLLPAPARATEAQTSARSTLVIPIPPTANGDLHVGHLSGPYIAADVLRRYRAICNEPAWCVTGSDDHQIYVEFRGRQEKQSPAAVANTYGEAIKATLDASRVELDHYLRTQHSERHKQFVQEFVAELHSRNAFVERMQESLWCDTCNCYLFEAYVSGGCPHCGSRTGGGCCEECGLPNDSIDIVDPVCNGCGGVPGRRSLKRLYFPLAPYAHRLAAYWKETPMHPHVQTMCERMLAAGLPEMPVAHYCTWGIPVPIEGYEDQRIAAWFEMNAFYLMLSDGLEGKPWQSYWQNEDVEIVQFHGFDNSIYQAAMFPAVLMAYDPAIRLPKSIVNEFYRLDGTKFSTSRRHVVWGRDLLERYPADIVRFHLAHDRPEMARTNFTADAIERTATVELAGAWQGWLDLLFTSVAEEYGGVVPATGLWLREHRRFYDELRLASESIAQAYQPDTFSLQRAARLLCEFVRTSEQFTASQSHWHGVAGREDERRTAVALALTAAKCLAIWASPLMPDFGSALWHDLGFDSSTHPIRWEAVPTWVPADQTIAATCREYFARHAANAPVVIA